MVAHVTHAVDGLDDDDDELLMTISLFHKILVSSVLKQMPIQTLCSCQQYASTHN